MSYAWSWADYEREKLKAERRKRDLETRRPVAAKLAAERAAGDKDAGDGAGASDRSAPDRSGARRVRPPRTAPVRNAGESACSTARASSDRDGGHDQRSAVPHDIPKGASVDAARQQRDVIGRRQEGSSPRTRTDLKRDAGKGEVQTARTSPDRGGAPLARRAVPISPPYPMPRPARLPSPRPEPEPLGKAKTPFDRSAKIDLAAAPSAMELAQAQRNAGGVSVMEGRPTRECRKGEVLCRCGGSGKVPGPVPHWFGDKCIETDCELRGRA